MKVIVTLETKYVVTLSDGDESLAKQVVAANWDTIYKHEAKALDFPPQLSGKVVKVEC